MDPSTVKTIRRYRLNKQWHRGGKRCKSLRKQMGINANMSVPVSIIKKIPLKDKSSVCLHMSLPNAQSIKDKNGAIVNYFLSNNIKIAIITESWLKSTKDNVCKLTTSEFNTGLFSAIPSNRQDRTGGGILLVHNKCYKADFIKEVFTHSFQTVKFNVQVDRCNITLLAIYCLLYSSQSSHWKNVY